MSGIPTYYPPYCVSIPNTNNINSIFLYPCIHIMYMSITTLSDLDECTIHFKNHEEQAKAFNYLIHSRIGFKGIDVDTIRLKQSACAGLDNNKIQYEITY